MKNGGVSSLAETSVSLPVEMRYLRLPVMGGFASAVPQGGWYLDVNGGDWRLSSVLVIVLLVRTV